jgi:hypothetical protein
MSDSKFSKVEEHSDKHLTNTPVKHHTVCHTLLYTDLTVLNVAVSLMCKGCKPIKIDDKVKFEDVLKLLETNVASKLFIFGITFTQEQLTKILHIGFEKVHIFLLDYKDRALYTEKTDEKSKKLAVLGKYFDPRVSTFSHTNFYEVFHMVRSEFWLFVMESILMFTFPEDYKLKIHITEISKTSSKHLITGLLIKDNNFKESLKELLNLESPKAFDEALLLTEKGLVWTQATESLKKSLATQRVATQARKMNIKASDGELTGLIMPCPDLDEDVKPLMLSIFDKKPSEEDAKTGVKELSFGIIYRLAFYQDPKLEEDKKQKSPPQSGYYVNLFYEEKLGLNGAKFDHIIELPESKPKDRKFFVKTEHFMKVFNSI